MKNSFQRRRATVSNRAYRRAYGGVAPVTIVIIALLVLVIITLSVIIAGYVKEDAKQSDETAPPTSGATSDFTQTQAQQTEPTVDLSAYDSITLSKEDMALGNLVLVNRENGYNISPSASHVNLYNNKDRHYSVALSSIALSQEAFDALGSMTDAFYSETGLEILQITSGFRTKEQQQEFYDAMVSSAEDEGYYELPGYSDHHTGLAFDVKLYLSDGTSLSYGKNAEKHAKWVVDNYHKYGFIMRYPGNKTEHTGIIAEGNHFRYVGIPHSVYMHDNDLCLEEYVSYLKHCTIDSPLKVLTSGKVYYVYYTQATGEETTVYVPKVPYTVCGNNTDGFIVTYCTE